MSGVIAVSFKLLLFIVLVAFYKMLPSITAVIRGLSFCYNKSSNRCIFCNKRFQAFLVCYMYKNEPPLLAIKNPLFWGIFFSSQIYLKAIFMLPEVFYTKRNAACTPVEMKQNLLHWIFLSTFSLVLSSYLTSALDDIIFFSFM